MTCEYGPSGHHYVLVTTRQQRAANKFCGRFLYSKLSTINIFNVIYDIKRNHACAFSSSLCRCNFRLRVSQFSPLVSVLAERHGFYCQCVLSSKCFLLSEVRMVSESVTVVLNSLFLCMIDT